jgi:hypothetical protein
MGLDDLVGAPQNRKALLGKSLYFLVVLCVIYYIKIKLKIMASVHSIIKRKLNPLESKIPTKYYDTKKWRLLG